MTINLIVLYFLCGVGVALGLMDEDSEGGVVAVIIFCFCVAIWPMLFMFAAVTAMRKIAEGRISPILKRSTTQPKGSVRE